jgi:hypothetical protein
VRWVDAAVLVANLEHIENKAAITGTVNEANSFYDHIESALRIARKELNRKERGIFYWRRFTLKSIMIRNPEEKVGRHA